MLLATLLALAADQAAAAAAPERIAKGSGTTMSFDIGTDGRVKNCVVTISSGSKTLDDGACRILTEKAKFAPKRDADGNPVEEIGRTTRIAWNIEN